MRVDGNTALFIFFIVFFVILPNNSRDQGATRFEVQQLRLVKEQLRGELAHLSTATASRHSVPRNVTGFRYTQADVARNREDYDRAYLHNMTLGAWLGADPVPGRDYAHGYVPWVADPGSVVPQQVLDTVDTRVWANKTSVDETNSGESVFPWNISGTLRGRVGAERNDTADRALFLPRPKYYRSEPARDLDLFGGPDSNNNMNERDENGQEGPGEEEDQGPEVGDEFLDYSAAAVETRKQYLQLAGRAFQIQVKSEYQHGHAWKVYALELSDDRDLAQNPLNMLGVYSVLRGQMFAFTQSAKFHPLFVVPTYFNVQDDGEFEELRALVNGFVNSTAYIDSFTMQDVYDWDRKANARCEFVGYFQLARWDGFSARDMAMLEHELLKPMGRPVAHRKIPQLAIESGVLYSPDCGLHYEVSDFAGPRKEVANKRIRWDIIAFYTAPYMLQLLLLLKQMNFTSTPSSLNKVSRLTMDMLSLVDGTMGLSMFISAIVLDSLFVPLILTSFVALILTLVFEMRYLVNIIASQANERNVSWSSLFQNSGGDTTEDTATVANNVIPDEQEIGQDLHGKFFFKLFIATFTMMTIASWSSDSRRYFEMAAIVVCNSYWWPQISRNFLIDVSPELVGLNFNWFVLGSSYIRLVPVAYVFCKRNNIFHHHQSRVFFALLFCYVTVQVFILKTQTELGGRKILPGFLMKYMSKYVHSKKKYNYHRKLTPGEVEEHGAVFVCPICMDEDDPIKVKVEDTDVDTDVANEDGSHNNDVAPEDQKTNEDKYMVTPCYHIFHTSCIGIWMNTKLQCPVCRQPLPPL